MEHSFILFSITTKCVSIFFFFFFFLLIGISIDISSSVLGLKNHVITSEIKNY